MSQQQLDPRLRQYILRTPALAGVTTLRVLLPAGYATHPGQRYPVVYLLHGCCNYDVSGAATWTVHGDAEKVTADLPVIVVMPDGGEGGMYSDWHNRGAAGTPAWETYHVNELIPWVDTQFRTRAYRSGRAVVGLSMGGFGAMSYAARHPDLFVFAASFSGIVDNQDLLGRYQAFDDGLAAQDGGAPGSVWGQFASDAIRWRAHNPVDLAENLRGLRLELRTGNGLPGGPYGGGPDPIEMLAHDENIQLNERFDQLGLPHVWNDYGAGAHQWPYWKRDLRETLPDLMATFADPPPVPTSVSFRAVEPEYAVFGWRVAMQRKALEFSTLSRATHIGFSLTGSGRSLVTTPPTYRPGELATVTITNHGRSTTSHVRADPHGRLHLSVPLGPPNLKQEDTSGAVTTVFRSTVTIGPT